MTAATVAFALAIALAVYLALMDWVNLAPWNKVDDLPVRQKALFSATNYTPLILIALGVVQSNPIFVAGALVIGSIDLLMHVAYWWLPYLRGASPAQIAEHAKLFGGTTMFLPAIADHPIPNAQHVVVGVLMSAMVASTAAALVAVI